MRSRLSERLPPAGRRRDRSGGTRSMTEIGELASWRTGELNNHQFTNSATHQIPTLLSGEGTAAATGGLGVWVLDREAAARDRLDEVDLSALQVLDADRVDEELDAVRFEHL